MGFGAHIVGDDGQTEAQERRSRGDDAWPELTVRVLWTSPIMATRTIVQTRTGAGNTRFSSE